MQPHYVEFVPPEIYKFKKYTIIASTLLLYYAFFVSECRHSAWSWYTQAWTSQKKKTRQYLIHRLIFFFWVAHWPESHNIKYNTQLAKLPTTLISLIIHVHVYDDLLILQITPFSMHIFHLKNTHTDFLFDLAWSFRFRHEEGREVFL